MGVSENSGTPKSSILLGFSIISLIIHFGVPLFLETAICFMFYTKKNRMQPHGIPWGEVAVAEKAQVKDLVGNLALKNWRIPGPSFRGA